MMRVMEKEGGGGGGGKWSYGIDVVKYNEVISTAW